MFLNYINLIFIFLVFNFILLFTYFENYCFLLQFFLFFIIIWVYFFKLNFYTNNYSVINSDSLSNTMPLTFINSYFLSIIQINLTFLLLCLFIFKGTTTLFWLNHFKMNNLLLNIIFFLLIFCYLFIFIIKNSYENLNTIKFDFFFTLVNSIIFLPLIFITNTFFTFFFILEINSTIIFYKFTLSRIWNKTNINYTSIRNLPEYYLNMLFFQFWSTFFSSVLILYVIIYYMYIYGTSEWMVLNLINYFLMQNSLSSLNFIFILIFIFGFLIKLGFSPVHLYKIEIYKGLSFITIFLYTLFYFIVFFFYFIILILVNLSSLIYYSWIFVFLLILFSVLYIISLLFNINYTKAFFAYSSIINSLGFLLIILAILS